MTSLSIIIPCYNEEENIKRGVLEEVDNYLKTQNFKYEVLICNDHSTDNSLTLVKAFVSKHPNFSVLNLPHGGKPSALFGGIKKAKYEWLLFTDMDQSTPLNQIEKLLPYFSDYDVVIGSRGSHREGNTFIRKLGSKMFLFGRRYFLLKQISDTQCGFKAIKTNIAKVIFPHLASIKSASATSGWRVSSYDVEMLHIAQVLGSTIKEVPVLWKNEDISTTKGGFNARYRRESQQMIQEIIRVKINDIKGIYNQTKKLS